MLCPQPALAPTPPCFSFLALLTLSNLLSADLSRNKAEQSKALSPDDMKGGRVGMSERKKERKKERERGHLFLVEGKVK